MSKATGIKGYTPDRLRRAKSAQERQAYRAQRDNEQQLVLLEARPGESKRERKRLTA